ncbi:MAG: hypothetical protein EAX89_12515 [Candidatus Lokiarchaeota archaeon]|nr:hypothetical protein [Candidatus Lokiarchaeota archaeon]
MSNTVWILNLYRCESKIINSKVTQKMLFITYWELNPDFDPSELAEIAQTLMSKKLYPVEGVKQIGFYVSTSDYWGITIEEAQNEEQMAKGSMMWRLAKPGYIKVMKTTPAMDATKIIPLVMKLKKEIKG